MRTLKHQHVYLCTEHRLDFALNKMGEIAQLSRCGEKHGLAHRTNTIDHTGVACAKARAVNGEPGPVAHYRDAARDVGWIGLARDVPKVGAG